MYDLVDSILADECPLIREILESERSRPVDIAAVDAILAEINSFIERGRGAWFEAEVFAALFLLSYIVRAFEFALADGAIDCDQDYPPDQSFADRFWNLYERAKG